MIQPKHKRLADRIQKKRQCARSSCRVYASNISRLQRQFLPKVVYNDNLKWVAENSEELLSKIKRLDNLNTRRNLFAASLIALDMNNETDKKAPFIKQISLLNDTQKKIAISGELTEKQASKFTDWGSIVKLRRLLARTVRLGKYYTRTTFSRAEFKTLQENLVVHLYTLLPPVRNDWSTVTFHTEKEWNSMATHRKTSTNNLVMARGHAYKIYWADYKTKKKHGVIMESIPKPLQAVLKRHIKFLRVHFPGNKSLLLTQTGTPMSRNLLTKFLQRLFFRHFRKKISTSALRSIFLTHKFNKKQLEEQRTVARQMHHTPDVQRDFYVKNK